MDQKEKLIAQIEAAWRKSHPDGPGVFDGEEWRCLNSILWPADVQVKPRCIMNCPLCHGTGRWVNLERVLEEIHRWERHFSLPRLAPHPSYYNIWTCAYSVTDAKTEHTEGADPFIAALRCMLAVVKTQKKAQDERL